jgi:hypothetical protein
MATQAQTIAALAKQVETLMASLNPVVDTPAKAAPVKRGPGRPKGTKSPVACITRNQAWALLGGDETYRPSEKSGETPASSAQLWSLNAKGMLAVK